MKYKYKPIIQMLRDLRTHLKHNSDNFKSIIYARTTGYIFGYITAWNNSNTDRITTNQIELIYTYMDALFNKYVAK